MKAKKETIGGQAVLDGVMMKSKDAIAVSVRLPNGSIVINRKEYVPLSKKHKWMGYPFIRGIVNLGSMLSMGMKTIQLSSLMAGAVQEEPTRFEMWLSKKLGKGIDKIVMYVAVALAIVLALGLFFVLPQSIGAWLRRHIDNSLIVNLLEAILRLTILLLYMLFCGKIPDIRKTFQYHGAEHRVVYCYENKMPLTPENASRFSSLHPRCGTSFLVIVFVLAFIVYSVAAYNDSVYMWRLLSRLALLPVVAGISFEVLRGLADIEGKFVSALRWPGLQVQRLTTKDPDMAMLEVAICSMNTALYGLPKYLEPDNNGFITVSSYIETDPSYMPADTHENEPS